MIYDVDFKNGIIGELNSDLFKGVKSYLASVPIECPETEHLLMVLRRKIFCIARVLNPEEYRCFISSLLEPALIHQVTRGKAKNREEIIYEIARLFSEMGQYWESMVLFDELIREYQKNYDNQYLYYLSLNGKAIVLQNLGLFEKAKEVLDPILNKLENTTNTEHNKILYFTYKHYATLLRRIHSDKVKPIKVFISYARVNVDKAEILERKLKEYGFDVWIDRKINPAEDWVLTIHEALSNSDYILLIVTDASSKSDEVKAEVNRFPDKVIPLIYDRSVSLTNFGRYIANQNGIDFGCFATGIEVLLNKLNKKEKLEILQYFKKAQDKYDTYHIHFSIANIHYLSQDPIRAKEEIDICKKMLGEYQYEYYLVFMREILIEMMDKRCPDKLDNVRNCLKKFENSLAYYGNFKSKINTFLINLINECIRGGINIKKLETNLPTMITSQEALNCIKTDVYCILNYFCPVLLPKIKRIFTSIASQFERISYILSPSPFAREETEGIAVHFDIRDFTKKEDENAQESLTILKNTLNKYFFHNFEEVICIADVFIFIKKMEIGEYGDFLLMLTERLDLFFQEIEQMNKNISIGVGISHGKLWELQDIQNKAKKYFLGESLIRASKMCDLARPKGIVIEIERSKNTLLNPDIRTALKEKNFKDWHNQEKDYHILVSHDVAGIYPYKYVYRHGNEKRIFINYGSKCRQGCAYCLSYNTTHFPEYSWEEIRKEVSQISQAINDYLISLGHLNECLDERNFRNTVELVNNLLDFTSCVIQISTKVNAENIKKILESINDIDKRKRVIIMPSVCTIEHAGTIENRKEMDWDAIAELSKSYNIVPLVKPFLPGITNKDSKLLGFLKKFNTVVVGFPYISRAIMKKISNICVKDPSLYGAIEDYNYTEKVMRPSSLYSSLTHPSNEKEIFLWTDYKQELLAFFQKIKDENKDINLFISSPCAVASLIEATSYTDIGNRENKELSELCMCNYDKFMCKNTSCLYNKENKKDIIARTIQLIKHWSLDHLDKSHDIYHFLRVKKLAEQIFSAYVGKTSIAADRREYMKNILSLSCLLHDIGDRKVIKIDAKAEQDHRKDEAKRIMTTLGIDSKVQEWVCYAIVNSSFEDELGRKMNGISLLVTENISSSEEEQKQLIMKILADADKIDAIGTIGIARCFGFLKNKGLFNIEEEPRTCKQIKLKPGYASAITHFFEKLIHLKSLFYLEESRQIAEDRQEYLKNFLQLFLDEYKIIYPGDSKEKRKIDELKSKIQCTDWWDK